MALREPAQAVVTALSSRYAWYCGPRAAAVLFSCDERRAAALLVDARRAAGRAPTFEGTTVEDLTRAAWRLGWDVEWWSPEVGTGPVAFDEELRTVLLEGAEGTADVELPDSDAAVRRLAGSRGGPEPGLRYSAGGWARSHPAGRWALLTEDHVFAVVEGRIASGLWGRYTEDGDVELAARIYRRGGDR